MPAAPSCANSISQVIGRGGNSRSLPTEVYEHPAEVVRVLLDAVIERLDILLVEESEHMLFQGARALAWYDLDQRRLLGHRFIDDRAQRPVDVRPPVVDLVQVQLGLHLVV